MNEQKSADTRGLITPFVERVVDKATCFSRCLLGNDLIKKGQFNAVDVARTAKKVDIWVLAFILGEIFIYLCVAFLPASRPVWAYLLLLPICYRVIDIASTAVRIPLFDIMHREERVVASNPRVVILGLINYWELVLSFGTFYAFFKHHIGHGSSTVLDSFSPLYLSVITQSTIGYGDLWPTDWLRWLACLQTGVAILVLLLIIGRFITNLPKARGLDEKKGS